MPKQRLKNMLILTSSYAQGMLIHGSQQNFKRFVTAYPVQMSFPAKNASRASCKNIRLLTDPGKELRTERWRGTHVKDSS